jgi:hypothetical protein
MACHVINSPTFPATTDSRFSAGAPIRELNLTLEKAREPTDKYHVLKSRPKHYIILDLGMAGYIHIQF